MSNNAPNPLKSYFRQVRNYITIPSSGSDFVDPSVIEFTNDRKEVSIKSMTSIDEIAIRNPDMLLNGEAIVQIISSCVSEVKNPKKLCINDVNVLMAAIKSASQGAEHNVTVECPACSHTNTYGLDLDTLLQHMSKLASEYVVLLGKDKDLKVYVRPYNLEGQIKAMSLGFEENKTFKLIQSDNADDQARIHAFSKAIKKISTLNFDLVSESVLKIVMADGVEVKKKEHIAEFLKNIESHEAKEIEELLSKINKIGLPEQVDAKCEKCEHEWKASVTFNPTDFFTGT